MNRADILILEKIKNFPIILVRTIWHNAIQELYKMLKEKMKKRREKKVYASLDMLIENGSDRR